MPKNLSFPEKLERFPPIVVRILARARLPRGGVRALTDAEIAQVSGLTIAEVTRLSRLTRWGKTPIDTLLAFCKGCGANLDDRDWQRHNAAYMAKLRSVPRYLRQSPDWESTFKPLLERYAQAEDAA